MVCKAVSWYQNRSQDYWRATVKIPSKPLSRGLNPRKNQTQIMGVILKYSVVISVSGIHKQVKLWCVNTLDPSMARFY